MLNLKFLVTLAVLLFTGGANAKEQVASIPTPNGFVRTSAAPDGFSSYFRALPLKPNNQIELWYGNVLREPSYNIMAVLDVPLLFNENLEQCADFSMRFWAEYLKSIDALERLSLFDFYGRKKPFSSSSKNFREYLHWHMTYSNSYSIKLGADKVHLLSELRPGDMFVQNESEEGIGHVSVVVDEAIDKSGLKVFLVGYSFMPAQQFHIERASDEYGIAGWFTAVGYQQYAKHAFGLFGEPMVMRFSKTN